MDQGEPAGEEDTTLSSLERIKKQLNLGSGNVLLQGPLLKRSDTLRKWNTRWFTLDVSTGKLEYRSGRGDPSPRGVVNFDADSRITVSPINIMKERKYDGCCFYHAITPDISTSQKKEYFFCAETPEAARAWVATLRAAALVLKAHREAVNLLSGNGQSKLGTVASVVAAANATAREAAKDLQMSMKASALAASASQKRPNPAGGMDSAALMKETLRVKDEELHQLVTDLKSRDLTIKELADRLTETAEAAESAASAVHAADKECKEVLSEVEELRKQLVEAVQQIRGADAETAAAQKGQETALQEAHRCRLELGKVRERGVIMEAAMMRVEEEIRRLKVAHEREIAKRLQPQPVRAENTPPAETPVADEPVDEETASEAPTMGLKVRSSEACLSAADVPSTSQAPVPESSTNGPDKKASGLTGEACDDHLLEAADVSETEEESSQVTGLEGQELRPSGAPSLCDASMSQTRPDHFDVRESADAEPAIVLRVPESTDPELLWAADLSDWEESKSVVHGGDGKDSSCEDAAVGEGGRKVDTHHSHSEEKEISVVQEEEVVEEVSHAATESHELVTSVEASREEIVMIKPEHHKREAHFRLCCF